MLPSKFHPFGGRSQEQISRAIQEGPTLDLFRFHKRANIPRSPHLARLNPDNKRFLTV